MPRKAPARLASARLVRPIARVTPARRATWGLGWHVRGGPRGHDAVRCVVDGGWTPQGGGQFVLKVQNYSRTKI